MTFGRLFMVHNARKNLNMSVPKIVNCVKIMYVALKG